jgi:hypothetical protein
LTSDEKRMIYETKQYRNSLILAAAVAGASLLSAAGPSTAEAAPHRWDAREDAAYQRYLMDEHLPPRDFSSLSAQEQRDYWDWRARNPGN